MTVQELIEILQDCNPEATVEISYLDENDNYIDMEVYAVDDHTFKRVSILGG